MNYRKSCELGKSKLTAAGVPEAELDARLLLEYVCGTDRNTLLVHGDRELTAAEEERYRALIERRAQRVPLQHLTGTQDFMGLTFRVNSHVLVPRQDTEILVEEVLRQLHDGMRILDLCTGSGCILISLLHYTNDCAGVGVDLSPEALEVARENAARLLESSDRERPQRDCRWVCGDLFEGVDGKYECIVSNPPYIRSGEIDGLMPEVRDHEPRMALDGHDDGLYFYRRIIGESPDYLTGGGLLALEIGCDQGEDVCALMERQGFREVRVVKDYAGLDRVVTGIRL